MLSLKFNDAFSEGLIFEYGPAAAAARYTLYPLTEGEVLGAQDRSTMCWMVAPVPLAVSVTDLAPLLKKERFADALPVAFGAKVTVNGTLCPAAIVSGNARPPRVN